MSGPTIRLTPTGRVPGEYGHAEWTIKRDDARRARTGSARPIEWDVYRRGVLVEIKRTLRAARLYVALTAAREALADIDARLVGARAEEDALTKAYRVADDVYPDGHPKLRAARDAALLAGEAVVHLNASRASLVDMLGGAS